MREGTTRFVDRLAAIDLVDRNRYTGRCDAEPGNEDEAKDLMKPNAYLKLGTVAMDFPFMADQPLF
jgi:hypothetical protein